MEETSVKEYICKLGDLNDKCPYRSEEPGHCKGRPVCSFYKEVSVDVVDPEEVKEKGYVRKERWYERF